MNSTDNTRRVVVVGGPQTGVAALLQAQELRTGTFQEDTKSGLLLPTTVVKELAQHREKWRGAKGGQAPTNTVRAGAFTQFTRQQRRQQQRGNAKAQARMDKALRVSRSRGGL